MFTDLAGTLPPSTEKVLFDYNEWDEASQTLTVGTMDEWVKKLEDVVAETRTKNSDAVIDLVCHSQGCVVAGLAKPKGLRKIVLIGPPAVLTPERMRTFFAQFPNTHIDFDNQSVLHRRDGSTTVVPPAYWQSIRSLDPIALYNNLANDAKVIIINAGSDEVVDIPDGAQVNKRIEQITIEGANHNFTDTARESLIQTVRKEMERYPVVNENDEVIGYKFRGEITKNDIYRVSALWVKNSRGDILLAQRALGKGHDPGKWGPAVAGTVEEGETYEQNIIKEAVEEIGLRDITVDGGAKRRVHDPWNYFSVTFTAIIDKPAEAFTIQEEEVAQVKWFTHDELTRELRDHPEQYLDMAWLLEI